MTAAVALVLATFLACAVEMVEATTIVLAVGLTRGWRAAMLGVGAGLATLAVIVAALGPAVSRIPIDTLRLVVGGLLLAFGLTWLRKAILRAAGLKALHDETAAFAEQRAAAQSAGVAAGFDAYGFTLSFKGVLLEGLEVAFIVLTFGSNQGSIGLAAAGAGAALVVVVAAAVAVRGPLARVPENAMKFVVGVMLASFGTFWGAEGAGADWPLADGAILLLVAFYAAVSLGLVAHVRARHAPEAEREEGDLSQPAKAARPAPASEPVGSGAGR